MDRLIETLATAVGNTTAWLAQSGALFLIFALIWAALAVAWTRRHDSIDDAWRRIKVLPLLLQLAMWLLLLPVMAALWIWERTAWPVIARAVLVLGICGWNLIVFLPSSTPA